MLTETCARKLKADGDKVYYWCPVLTGFGCCAYPSGKKSYVLRYRLKGQKKMLTIGSVEVLTCEDARQRARVMLLKVVDGIDPSKASAAAYTFDNLITDYLELYAVPHKVTWRKDRSYIERFLRPAFGGKALEEIEPLDVQKAFSCWSAATPTQANRALEVLKKMFEMASTWQRFDRKNPATGLRRNQEKSRERFLEPEEAARVMEATLLEKNIFIRAAFLLLYFTGCRKNEVLSLRWENVNLERARIKIEQTKNGSSYFVPITEPIAALLTSLPKQYGCPYVFPSRQYGMRLTSIDHAWERIRTRANISDVWIHDIRRTMGSWLAEANTNDATIGKVLNHKDPKSTKVYARLRLDPMRQALQSFSDRFLAASALRLDDLKSNLASDYQRAADPGEDMPQLSA